MGQHRDSLKYRHLYQTKRWKNLRKDIFERDGLRCQICGCLCYGPHRHHPRAPVADHRDPHHGAEDMFFDPSNVQTLCKMDHDKTKRGIELRGYSTDTDDDGWPTDPNHPANLRE